MKVKEFLENTVKFNSEFVEADRTTAGRDPLQGHEITREYRTKMADWMIEVTTSFKCCQRTYFVAMSIFDKYLIASSQNGVVLSNKEVHSVGVISMYIASKFEDVFPLHSKIVSEKIAHGTMTPKQIVAEEQRYLSMFGYSVDFVTHFDFYETFLAQVQNTIQRMYQTNPTEISFLNFSDQMMQPLSHMTLILVKMSLQCIDFSAYSPSVVVLSALYASTAFVKHSKTYKGDFTSRFCQLVRKVVFDILQNEL